MHMTVVLMTELNSKIPIASFFQFKEYLDRAEYLKKVVDGET